MTRSNCKTRDIILKAMFLELCPFLNLEVFFVKSIIYFDVVHYSKSSKDTNKNGILAHHDKVELQSKGHNSESNIFGDMFLFN